MAVVWDSGAKGPSIDLSDGDLTATHSGSLAGPQYATLLANTAIPATGKWYWEINFVARGTTPDGNVVFGVANSSAALNSMLGGDAYGWGWIRPSRLLRHSGDLGTYGPAVNVGDVIGIAVDADAHTLRFYKNGADQDQAFSDLSGSLYPAVGFAYFAVITANFGATAFAYSIPSGYSALDSGIIIPTTGQLWPRYNSAAATPPPTTGQLWPR